MATKVLKKGRINSSTLQYINKSTNKVRHNVSSRIPKLPTVTLEGDKITASSVDESVLNSPLVAVKQKINLRVLSDGSIEIVGAPNNEEVEICLGNQYDRYVTILHFDLSQLNWKESDKTNYLFRLSFYDEDVADVETRTIDNEQNYFYFAYEPITYEFDGEDFFVPMEITKKATHYKMVLIIQEKVEDEEEGNLEGQIERFISKEWKGYVEPNFFDPILPLNAISYTNRNVALSKEPIGLILADDGTLALESEDLGNSNDAFIRTFKPTITAHLLDFNVYMLFLRDKRMYASRVDKDQGAFKDCFIPAEVCKQGGTWEIMMVAYKGDISNPDYLFTSTVVEGCIEGNFLEEGAFDTSEGVVGSMSANNMYSNFITRDGKIITTKDGYTFFYDEE